MNFSLKEKQLSIQRLRTIFGIKTESAKNLAKFIEQQTEENALDQSSKQTDLDAASGKKILEGKHGHRSSSDYTQAKTIGGVKIFPRDRVFENYLGSSRQVITGLPENWTPFLSKIYYSLAYQNPEDPMEYLAIVPSAVGKLPHIVHYTGEGYVDPNWFNNVVPILYALSMESEEKIKVNRSFKNEKLTLGQVNTINHFFKADPILKVLGICPKCYEVSLPKKGFGVRYFYSGEIKELSNKCIIKEIRFSAAKSFSLYEGSKRPYVTELVIAPPGTS
jgi:hypothetical protein